MKTIHLLVAVIFALILASARGALPVTDVALLVSERDAAARNSFQQLLLEVNQETQIVHLLTQIRQLDENLRRTGDPALIQKLTGSDFIAELLKSGELNKNAAELLKSLDGHEVLQPRPGSIYKTVEATVMVDGKPAGDRDLDSYRPEAAMQRTLDQFDQVRDQVLERRNALKQQIAAAMEQLRAATSDSEVQKIAVVVNALNSELGAVDRDLDFSAMEAAHQASQNDTQRRVEQRANIENERASFSEATRRDAQIFRISTEPVLFSR